MIRKKLFLGLSSLLLAGILHAAAEDNVKLLPVDVDVQDRPRLQRGAKMFMNYCSGCHSLKYMRYNRMAHDLGLTTFDGEIDTDLLVSNLIFTRAPIYDPIRISMPAQDAQQWFGKVPPDLSLSARERGPSWLYTYLKGFYVDKTRPFGANNILIPGVAMPNVLEPLAGKMVAVENKDAEGNVFLSHLLLAEPGEMTSQEFDSAVTDLVNFLVYVGEPAKLVRYRAGGVVIAFLLIFLFVVYRLKKSYWEKIGH
ncbi:ubiquinol-cytochrome c reductase cytochrome c1 subunit [Legionella birminghamensis]|uniref:Ubiquinol-cytochrome c reductase cytochrome c1 subunit n=1 Tax=Legionella birminghamensis TaxID=28083 RepID=A0A378I7K8_9GAMM|nr:cytochrome c1 [Legionella birminghamensis]KTC73747.1 ubiquinol-cytochrome c reductase cytochrome c1 subunit [Legionella birminghamensis]STX30756.1 ubiquinol-cytochrome c reductase cytochrome c1 subunit [Legionella birminghamensis]